MHIGIRFFVEVVEPPPRVSHFAATLQALIGKWHDSKGSIYEVWRCPVKDSSLKSVSVTTTRKNGYVQTTNHLIRIDEYGEVSGAQYRFKKHLTINTRTSENKHTNKMVA